MLTFGAELEYADFVREGVSDKIRDWGIIDVNDVSVVNSDGTVGGPHNTIGGECVTRVCNSTTQLAEYCTNIFNSLEGAKINHSCWLHIHVGINRELNLQDLKDILERTYFWQLHLLSDNRLNPPKVNSDGLIDIRRNQTRTSVPTYDEYKLSMSASTIDDFWQPLERKRHLINLRPLRSYGTIEYRFFPAANLLDEFLESARAAEEITLQILDQKSLDVSFNVFYNRKHTVIDEELEAKFRAASIPYYDKVNNFTGEKWNG